MNNIIKKFSSERGKKYFNYLTDQVMKLYLLIYLTYLLVNCRACCIVKSICQKNKERKRKERLFIIRKKKFKRGKKEEI